MCGIAVAIGVPDADRLVRRMIGGLEHRGEVSDPVVSPVRDAAMGTRRLPIVDAQGGIQPKLSFDGRIAVSMNGEIYNHRELRAELELLGARFESDSDTEVLANALSIWGARALRRLVGMYAFVALDTGRGEFLAARDPFGVKPLYVIEHGPGFVFCSEITPLIDAVDQGEVMLLPPGYSLSRKVCAPYKSAISDPQPLARPSDPVALDALLAAAVARRTPGGLPVALMFSGGIDSTLIAHYARRYAPGAPGYFLGRPDAPDHPYALAYAERSGLELRRVEFGDPADVAEQIEATVLACESFEPAVVRDAYLTGLISRHIRRDGFRVALCGEGPTSCSPATGPWSLRSARGRPSAPRCGTSVWAACIAATCNASTARACVTAWRPASPSWTLRSSIMPWRWSPPL